MVGYIGYKPFLMRFLRTIPMILSGAVILLASCASERSVSYSRGNSGFGERYMSDVQYERQDDGSVRPNKDVRSQYDGKTEYISGRDFGGKDYTTEKYGKKRWGQNTNYGNKKYAGGTDGSRFQYSPQFVQQQARMQGQQARVSGQNYGTGQYATAQANVANRNRSMDKPSDAETNVRRGVYKQPDVISKEDYSNISVEESRRLLGR